MARLRASFASFADLRSSASMRCCVSPSVASGVLHSGHRFAKPGLSGFSSNSSEQIVQTLIGNAIHLNHTTFTALQVPVRLVHIHPATTNGPVSVCKHHSFEQHIL